MKNYEKILSFTLVVFVILCLASCEFSLKHEHIQDEKWSFNSEMHWKNVTCTWNMCKFDIVTEEHCDNDGNLFCDVCGYEMSIIMIDPPPVAFCKLQGVEWLDTLQASDVAEIRMIGENSGVAPGSLKNISTSTNSSTIERIVSEWRAFIPGYYYGEHPFVPGGSHLTVEFVMNDGTVKSFSVNNDIYSDTNGSLYTMLGMPTFHYVSEYTMYHEFVSYTDKCEIWHDDPTEPYFVCDIMLEELKFNIFNGNMGTGVSEYPYFIETDFGRLGFIRNDVFFIVGSGGPYYQLVGKNLDEIIDGYKDKYSVTMNDEDWLYEDLKPGYAAGEEVSVKIKTATDLGFLLFVNGERVMPEGHIDAPYWEFIFTMPQSDVVIGFKTYDGFLPDMNYAVLIETFWEKIPKADSVSVIHYYGEFSSGAMAAMMTCSEYDYDQALWDEVIDGVVIHYNNGNRILVLYEGEFYNLTQAYSNGYISAEDLADIAELQAEFYPFL